MNDTEKVSLRDFLSRNPNFLEELTERAPVCKGATMEERAVSGSERQGWQNAVEHIKQMAKEDNTQVESAEFIQG